MRTSHKIVTESRSCPEPSETERTYSATWSAAAPCWYAEYAAGVLKLGRPLDVDTRPDPRPHVRQFLAWLGEAAVDGDPLGRSSIRFRASQSAPLDQAGGAGLRRW
jgi:hypothetical protein